MAAQLTTGWTESLWRQVEQLLAGSVSGAKRPPRTHDKRPYQRQRRLGHEQVAALVADYRSGLSIHQLTRKYGLRYETACRWLDANDVPRRPKGGVPATRLDEAIELRGRGWTYAQIAEHVGCSKSSARRAVLGVR